MIDRKDALAASAWGFAGATCVGTVVSLTDGVVGEPFGIRPPISVPLGLAIGWGAGVAAPWPMAVTAVAAATSHRRQASRPGLAWLCAALGTMAIVGSLAEPVARHPLRWSPRVGAAVLCNLTAAAALMATGLGAALAPG